MENKFKELCDFYLLDGKLLYVSREFIGFDPVISKGLSCERNKKSNTTIKLDEFKLGDSSFNAILTNHISWGPLSGYRRAEILRNGRTIINYEHGGMGHGSNYCKGNYFHLENGNAFLLKNGYALRDVSTGKIYSNLNHDNDYLFWFKDVVIPIAGKLWPVDGSALDYDKIYHRAEIEPLRQIQWDAHVNFNSQHIYIKKTAVPYCWQTLWESANKYEEFKRMDQEGFRALGRIEFNDIGFERY